MIFTTWSGLNRALKAICVCLALVLLFCRAAFSRRKTITKVISLATHNRRKQHNEPIRTRSKLHVTIDVTGAKRGKTRASNARLLLVCFSLAEKVAQVLSANQRAQQSKTQANA